jgi:uncharacterized membrane protein
MYHRALRGDGALSIRRRWNTARFLQKTAVSYLAVLGVAWAISLGWEGFRLDLLAVVGSAYLFWFFVPFLALSAVHEVIVLALRGNLEETRSSPMTLRPVADKALNKASDPSDISS